MPLKINLSVAMMLVLLAQSLLGSAPVGRYTDETGSTLTAGSTQVKDTVTGLIWQRAYSTGTWSASAAAGSAQAYCAQLVIGSQAAGSWRMPTIKELSTLVDVTVSSGATIDLTAFPGTPANYFWSSTVYQPSPSNAWSVDFSNGSVNTVSIGGTGYVRCVR
ncbi:MAG: DUF1566 domain-containing protein [Myxococcaceae bacterium]|nr:DUF1566 domain-containing protein [Myxococcaceae bacterium]